MRSISFGNRCDPMWRRTSPRVPRARSTRHTRHPKFFPKFVGPFVIKELRGVNTVELSIGKGTRFGLIDAVVNVERLRPYKRRPAHLGPTEEAQQPEALVEDPRGGTWWEVEDVVAHRGRRGKPGRRFLVRVWFG